MSSSNNNYWSNKIFVSKGTLIGFIIFGLTLTVILLIDLLNLFPGNNRIIALISALSLIIFLLGFIVDQLIFREFNFWAFGALVSFFGVALFFSPVILYGFGSNDYLLWIILVVLGILLILGGYFIEGTDLNQKFAKKIKLLIHSIRNYQWKVLPGRILGLVVFITRSLLIYLLKAIRNANYLINAGIKSLIHFVRTSIIKIYALIVSIPTLIIKTIKTLFDYSAWLILPAIVFVFFHYQSESFIGLTSLVLLSLFFFSTLFIYKKRDSIPDLVNNISTTVYTTYLNSQSRLVDIKAKMGIYKCQNCKEKINTMMQSCPNCEKSLTKCMICILPIEKETKLKCSFCQNFFHENHINHWLKLNNKNCPVCRKILSKNDLIPA